MTATQQQKAEKAKRAAAGQVRVRKTHTHVSFSEELRQFNKDVVSAAQRVVAGGVETSGRNLTEETSHFLERLYCSSEPISSSVCSHRGSSLQPRLDSLDTDRWALRPVTCLPAPGYTLQVSWASNSAPI